MTSKNKSAIIVSITAVVYIIHLVFNALAGRGETDLFPRSVGEASKEFELDITPVGATFSIWGIIFAYQLIWIIYAISTLFRNGDHTNILSSKFYISFITNIIFITIWLFLWTRLEAVPSFIVLTIAQVFIQLSIGLACSDLANYEDTHEMSADSKADVLCQRILVQNGLLFYGGWTTIATLLNTGIVLTYEIDVSSQTSSIIMLVFLAVLMVTWFVLETFVFQKYCGYTIAEYVAFIYGLSGVIANVWGKDEPVAGLTLALLILAVIFFAVRLVVIILRGTRRANYDTIGYNAQNQAVTR